MFPASFVTFIDEMLQNPLKKLQFLCTESSNWQQNQLYKFFKLLNRTSSERLMYDQFTSLCLRGCSFIQVQIDPYLEDSMCSTCHINPGPFFCRDPLCFKYFCHSCWGWHHSIDSLRVHKPMTRHSKTSNGKMVLSQQKIGILHTSQTNQVFRKGFLY